MNKVLAALCTIVFLLSTTVGQAYANNVSERQRFQTDSPWYWPGLSQACSGTGTTGKVQLTGKDPETQVWNFLKNNVGLSNEQAAGVMGNIQQESNFDPERIQNGGDSKNPADAGSGGWGLVQWTPGAKALTEAKRYKVSGNIFDLATQLEIVWDEMKGTSPVGVNNMLAGLRQVTGVDEAAVFFVKNFEGGTDPPTPSGKGIREIDAEAILKQYSGAGGGNGGGVTITNCNGITTSGSCKVTKPVYMPEYSLAQFAKIFGNPGTATSHPALHLVNIKEWGFATEVSPLVAGCLDATVKQIQSENIPYKVRLFGCYRFDSNNGSSNIGLNSYHTYGAACDINWDTNPFVGSGAPTAHDMPQLYVNAFYEHGFTWGGSWSSPKDYMHFEWHGVVP